MSRMTPFKIMKMRFVNSRINLVFLISVFSFLTASAQEVIQDSVKVPEKPFQRTKIDGIVGVVGDYMVLDSDIDKSFLELTSQGQSVKDITRCQMMGKLLEDRLYAHHAVQDSIKVSDAEINGIMDEKIAAFVEQIGSMDKVI